APDPIGLWGPDGTGLPGPAPVQSAATSTALTSGVDNYYLSFLAHRAATAIARADSRLQPARLKLAYASLPSNVQECWSTYPFTADQLDPVMQAVDSRTRKVIFTMVNGNTHVETFAFSRVAADTTMFSADWAGLLRQDLAARYGGVGLEMSGLVGSVETPTVYSPASTQVVNVPGAHHNVAGNPDGCASVYPNPATGSPVSNAFTFVTDYARAMASSAETALATTARSFAVHHLLGQHTRLCLQLESNFFAAAFASGIFADRPGYVDPTCSVGASFNKVPAPAYHLPPGPVQGANALWLKTDVAVLTVGPAQLAYVPGEMFPVTAIRGALDSAQMPFPTNCYDPTSRSYTCGTPLPMTPWISSKMTEPYRFMAGLGEDMIGYMMPPGDFVGSTLASQSTPQMTVGAPPEVNEQPWMTSELTTPSGSDRFGYGHSDDSESVGPHVGLEVTRALAQLLEVDAAKGIGHPQRVLPGMYVDAAGHLADSPFASSGFTGAVGVVVRNAAGAVQSLVPGCNASGWVTFDGAPDPGTAGTALPYSVSTAGVLLASGRPLLVDLFAGASLLPPTGVASPFASCSPVAAVPEVRVAALLPLAGLLVLVVVGGLLWRRRTQRSPGTPEV
ncbi:MAG: hypothetical protein ACYDB7_04885, partial [Mycobacteriales bacterium]